MEFISVAKVSLVDRSGHVLDLAFRGAWVTIAEERSGAWTLSLAGCPVIDAGTYDLTVETVDHQVMKGTVSVDEQWSYPLGDETSVLAGVGAIRKLA